MPTSQANEMGLTVRVAAGAFSRRKDALLSRRRAAIRPHHKFKTEREFFPKVQDSVRSTPRHSAYTSLKT